MASYLVAAIGKQHAVLAQCFAEKQESAIDAVNAIFSDMFGEVAEFHCIDEKAMPGLWIEGSPDYIRRVLKGK